MHSLRLLYIFPLLILTTSLHVRAQGSLGDPIYTFNFGAGTNPGPALGTGYTNMTYTTGCPDDGQYTIVNSLNSANNCHPDTWQNLPTDHTHNTNGYFMLINASFTPSVFFTAPLPANIVLCQNTTYRFSAYICNLIEQSASSGTIDPDITFTVTAPDGTVLPLQGTPNTGAIVPNDPSVSPWQQFGVTFNTMGYTTVTVTMTNNAEGGNGNDLALDDISFTAYGPAVSTPVADIGSGPLSLCQGASATYSFSTFIQPNVYVDPAVIWQENINGAGWINLPNETQQTLNIDKEFKPANTPGTYQYRQGVAESSNINSPNCRVYSDPVTITVNALPVITGIEPSQTECAGDVLILNASGGESYVWTGPDMAPTNVNPLIIPNISHVNSGIYKVIATSASICQSTMTTKVTVFPKPHIEIKGITVICEGETTQLTASGGTSYSWSPGSTLSDSTSASPIASPKDTTQYKVIGTNIYGCPDTDSVTIRVAKKAIVHAGSDKIIFEGQSVKLTASVEYTRDVYWTPATGLSDPDILDPIATPDNNITYTLHGVSKHGCGIDSSMVFIRVYKKVIIPNTFSPNNDGRNDVWDIGGLITYPNAQLSVFNRYGQLVYKCIGSYKPWEGTYNGKPVPAGTYYYVIDLEDNAPKLSGYVMVVR